MDLLPVMGFSKATTAYRQLDESEKSYLPRTQIGLSPGKDMVLISENGLYKLALRSDKKSAKPFQDWVTKVVLPAIRKDAVAFFGKPHKNVLRGIENLECSTAFNRLNFEPVDYLDDKGQKRPPST